MTKKLPPELTGDVEPGAPGKFPEGKLDPSDEGELAFRIAADRHNGIIRVEFGKPVAWIGLPPPLARDLALMLLTKADELEGKLSRD